jgi:hypothetical protein
MKYTVEVGSGAVIYVPSFIKIDSGIQKLIGRDSKTRRDTDLISLFLFFRNKESMLKQEGTLSKKCLLFFRKVPLWIEGAVKQDPAALR